MTKSIEVVVEKASFSETHSYRLKFEGDHETELSKSSKTPAFAHSVYVPFHDGAESIEVVLVGIVDGTERIFGTERIDLNPTKDFQHVELEFFSDYAEGGRFEGRVSLMYKVSKLSTLVALCCAAHGKSVCGVNITSALVGENATLPDASYENVRIRIRNAHMVVLGSGRLSNKNSTLFLQLEEDQVHSDFELAVIINDDIKENAEPQVFLVPLRNGPMAVTVPISLKLGLLITLQTVSQQAQLSGVIHEISSRFTRELDPKSTRKSSIVSQEGAFLALLLKETVAFFNIIGPPSTPATGSTESDITAGIHPTPLIRSQLAGPSVGTYVVCHKTDLDGKQKATEKAITKKLQHVNNGIFSIPTSMSEDAIQLQCSLVDVNCEIIPLEDSSDGQIASSNGSVNRCSVYATGVLTEVYREITEDSGVIACVIEGEMTIKSELQQAKSASLDAESGLFLRVILSIAPSDYHAPKSEEDADGDPSAAAAEAHDENHEEEGDAASRKEKEEQREKMKKKADGSIGKEKPNSRGEMPGQSILEDPGLHGQLIRPADKTAGFEYEQYDENDDFFGSPGFGNILSPKAMLGRKRANGAGTALAHMIKSELIEKQRLIERLMNEASARVDAIEVCGREIRALREDVALWQSRAKDAEAALTKREGEITEASRYVQEVIQSPDTLTRLDRTTLVHVANDIGEKFKKADAERLELKRLVVEAQSARRQYQEQKTALEDLQEAHIQQSRFIQKLQKKQSKMDLLKSTIQMQERVIAKMQAVIEARLRTARQESGNTEGAGLLDKLLADIEKQDKEAAAQASLEAADSELAAKQRAIEEELKQTKGIVEMQKKKVCIF